MSYLQRRRPATRLGPQSAAEGGEIGEPVVYGGAEDSVCEAKTPRRHIHAMKRVRMCALRISWLIIETAADHR